jgi:acyl CoA:acetate/3-ketoacid CoA transferase beta subunit
MEITPDEIIVFCIASQIKGADVIVQGLATPLVAAGFMLARKIHSPDLFFASAIGQGISKEAAPLRLITIEGLWIERNMIHISFIQVACEILPWLHPIEFFRPAQVDQFGNTNNIQFGTNYAHPRLRLPGTGGIPDMTVFSSRNHLYVPRHTRLTFVEKLDFISGEGHIEERQHGAGPVYLVSDLGQFDYANGRMRLISTHPGISVEEVQRKTGFQIEIAPDLTVTPLPNQDELDVLRTEIDPLGIRRLELLSGSARKELIHHIIEEEMNLYG